MYTYTDHTIRLFRFDHIQYCSSWKQRAKPFKEIHARDIGWSIIDVDYSPDSKFIIYSSWSPYVHLAAVDSMSDYHEGLFLDPEARRFCAFSVKFSPDSREILAGANDHCLYVFDLETNRRTVCFEAHDNDINTVCFGDDSGNLIFSGSDDAYCKAWDRRIISNDSRGRVKPVSVFVGHTGGITCVSARGDSRYMISNSKDQSLKLWDMRKVRDYGDGAPPRIRNQSDVWDYRYDIMSRPVHRTSPHDTSVMTYTGHRIVQTLIRCYFSPRETTGQRYIYTGSYDNKIYVYDVLTGEIVQTLTGHSNLVRDVSWHPKSNDIISSSWDGLTIHWSYRPPLDEEDEDERRHRVAVTQIGRSFGGDYDDSDEEEDEYEEYQEDDDDDGGVGDYDDFEDDEDNDPVIQFLNAGDGIRVLIESDDDEDEVYDQEGDDDDYDMH